MSTGRIIAKFVTIIYEATPEMIKTIDSSVAKVVFIRQGVTYEQVSAVPDTVSIIETNYPSSAFLLAKKPHMQVNLLNPETQTYELYMGAQSGHKRTAEDEPIEMRPAKRAKKAFEDKESIETPAVTSKTSAEKHPKPTFKWHDSSSEPIKSRFAILQKR